MILLVDMGNTATKWCLWQSGLAFPAMINVESMPTENFSLLNIDVPVEPTKILLAIVVDPAIATSLQNEAEQRWRISIQVVNVQHQYAGLTLSYPQISQFGVDRWLSMLAGWQVNQDAFMLVSFGTAITIDVVDAMGRHQGGVIAPNWRLMVACVNQHTFKIKVKPVMSFGDLADNTDAAVNQGAIHAVLGLIHRVHQQQERALGRSLQVMVTGGDALDFAPYLPMQNHVLPNLVLRGLALIAETAT